MMVLVLGGCWLGLGRPVLIADVADNPYQGIVERNVFNLKPPVDPATLTPPVPPPPKITLTGFTTILGNKRVLFKVQVPAKPPAPAKEESSILAEGQSEGGIEVLEIDEKAGVAKFDNHGVIQTLNLANDGTKPSSLPMPTAPPPLPNQPSTAPNLNALSPNPDVKSIPQRTLRLPPMPGAPAPRTVPGPPGAPPQNMPRPPGP